MYYNSNCVTYLSEWVRWPSYLISFISLYNKMYRSKKLTCHFLPLQISTSQRPCLGEKREDPEDTDQNIHSNWHSITCRNVLNKCYKIYYTIITYEIGFS